MVSVIIPTYNYGKYIPDTIKSVLAQSYQAWECIIVDDGSTDNTKEIILPFLQDKRIKYIFQVNKGLAAARNTGILNAKGDLILFLDSDDLIERDKLKHATDYFHLNKDIDIIYGDMRYFRSEDPSKLYFDYKCDDSSNVPWMTYISGKGKKVLSVILKGNIMVVSSPIFKHDSAKPHLFDEELKANEDWDFWLRMLLSEKRLAYNDGVDSKTLIRTHEGSMSKDVFKMFVYGLKVLINNSENIKKYGLDNELKKRIYDHRKYILRSVAKSDQPEFEQKQKILKQLNLFDVVFSGSLIAFRISRVYFKIRSVISNGK